MAAHDANEQYLLELINRARLDPIAELARYNNAVATGQYAGTTLADLNSGLASGTISGAARQVLAPNSNLELAASRHSLHMLAVDQFAHGGIGDGDIGSRATSAGYSYSWLGENISWTGTTGALNRAQAIEDQHFGLFRSSGHRSNLMNANYSEGGMAQEVGQFTAGGTTYNASMLTEMFGSRSGAAFVTGVVYNDTNGDRFYSIGEGAGGVSISSGVSATSAAAGGYGLQLANGLKTVAIGGAVVKLNIAGENIKLDLVSANKIFVSASVTLVSGVAEVSLLGIANLNATGTAGADTLNGNRGNNFLLGLSGNDFLYGQAGNDVLSGGLGNDTIIGGLGADVMVGGLGNDQYYVDVANDIVTEALGGGADRVYAAVSYTLAAGQNIEILSTTNPFGLGAINLTGNTLNNTVIGNAGVNILNGGGGVDQLYGYGGNDSCYVDNALDAVFEALGGGADRVFASVSYTLAAGQEIEILATNNQAGLGAINLTGNAFGQTMHGNGGASILNGGAGNDVLSGFGGADTFVFNTALNAATNRDTIMDYNSAADTIRLENTGAGLFNTLALGVLNALFLKANATGTATDADDRIIYNTVTGALFYDSNGSALGGATQFATLNTHPIINSADFVVV